MANKQGFKGPPFFPCQHLPILRTGSGSVRDQFIIVRDGIPIGFFKEEQDARNALKYCYGYVTTLNKHREEEN